MSRAGRVCSAVLAAVAALAGPAVAGWSLPAHAATSGVVTVRTVPAVSGATFELGGQLGTTDPEGTVTFETADLDSARTSVQLVSRDVGGSTRVELLHVAADPNHAIGARLLVAEVALSRPVSFQFYDRHGAPVPYGAVTGMTLKSSTDPSSTADDRYSTVRPDGSTVWLPSATAIRGVRPPGEARSVTYTVQGVRAAHVPVAVGDAGTLTPDQTSWDIPLAGYPFNVTVRTEPAVASVALRLDDQTVTTDATGTATFYTGQLDGVADRLQLASRTATPNIRVRLQDVANDGIHRIGTRSLTVGLGVRAAVRFTFVDVRGHHVPADRVTWVKLGGAYDKTESIRADALGKPVWLTASRLSQTKPPQAHEIKWGVEEVNILGTNAVFAGGQKFDPVLQQNWLVRLHLYRLQVNASDMLFGQDKGGTVTLTAPDESQHMLRLRGGQAVFDQVPRGEYVLRVSSGVRSMSLPVRVTRDQVVPVRVVSGIDVVTVLTIVVAIGVSIVWLGLRARRARLARAPVPAPGTSTFTKVGAIVVLGALLGGAFGAGTAAPARAASICRPAAIRPDVPRPTSDASFPVPVWGYYYIWFTATSWHRAKIDSPQLGCYTSDDVDVMRAHIRMAQSAGLTGFLVSWKHTPDLDRRLALLTSVAREEHFSLGIVYEALDFYRQPLPAGTVRRDLSWFAAKYGRDPVFAGNGKPLAVWTGTENYAAPVISAVGSVVRNRLTLLASAKSDEDYLRVAPYVDGDAYYWSSGDPAVPSYAHKLSLMGATVHAHDGLWLAPAAPGFNARALGGHRNITRKDGVTLRLSLAAALASAPDALGIISWNEWSENTYVEPSFRYGKTDLAVLAETLHGSVPRTVETDSSDDIVGQGGWRAWHSLLVIVGVSLLTVVSLEQRRRHALHREVVRALRGEYPQLANASRGGTDGHGEHGDHSPPKRE